MNIKELENKCLKPILYSVYGNELCGDTLQDLLSNMVAYINETIKQTNDNTILVNNLNDWIRNQGLKEEVINQLNVMVDNGTFESIINQEVFGDLYDRVNKLEINDVENTEKIKANIEKIKTNINNINLNKSSLDKINYCNVYNEDDITTAIESKIQSIIFKNNIVINNPIDLDGFNVSINLNGFTLKIGDTYVDDYIFRIGKSEYLTFKNKYIKWIRNGIIDLNNKECYVLNHSFSWSLNCTDLRCINAKKGFIKYTVLDDQTTRGAECLFDNISMIGSDDIGRETLAFDLWIGDSIYTRLFSQYFTYGVMTRVAGSIVTDSHVWGLPYTSGNVNKVMKIGYINREYNNRFVNCISDTPERYDISQQASLINGGIAYYDEKGSTVWYNNCDIIPHSETENNSIICLYIDKPLNLEDKYYGQSFHVNNCFTRTPSKVKIGIKFDGVNRVINVTGGNLAINKGGRVMGYNQFCSNTTVFKKDISLSEIDKINDFDLCKDANQFQIINDDYGIKILLRDSSKSGKWIALHETPNNPYTKAQLQEFANKLKPMSEIASLNLYTNNIICVLYDSSISEGQVGRYDQVWWNRLKKQFYNFRTGQFITD